jgi:hypothetical protein
MPSGKNWLNFVYVNLGFIVYIIGLYYIVSVKEIKDNWPMYRCNPLYMPLADNMKDNFTYCIQTITSSFMGYMLQPLTFITNSLQSNMSSFSGEINAVRGMFNKVRDFISNIFQTIFSVFLNIIIEFQKIIIGLRDLFGKTIGVLTTILYVVDGSLMTMNSAWNGPTGQLVRALGACFHPETQLRLKNGEIKCMKDIDLGDVLINGSVVYSTMKIAYTSTEDINDRLYEIKGMGVNGTTIYVTGSHLIFDTKKEKFVLVKDYFGAQPSDLKTEWFSCLITNDHKICVGHETFWDWEDHFIKQTIL